MRVMINTDVLLDHIANRAPYADTAFTHHYVV